MKTIQLANALVSNCMLSREAAVCWAWRILNEYEDAFRTAAVEIAEKGNIPSINVRGVTLETVMKISGISSALYALELMRIYSADEKDGKDLMFSLGLKG